MSELQIIVDRELCLGAQNCRHIAPGIFEIDDDGLSRVMSTDPAGLDLARAAAQSCPSGAISVEEPSQLSPALVGWIEDVAGGGEARVTPFGHSRPLWSVDVVRADTTVELFVRGARDPGSVLASVYNLEREAHVIRALSELRVPTPSFVGFQADEQVLVLERVPGRGDFHTIEDSAERDRVAHRFVEVLADLHSRKPADFGLAPIMRIPTTPEEHALGELEIAEPRYDAEDLSPEPVLTLGRQWLRHHVPRSIAHTSFLQGDTGPGNFVFHEDDVWLVDFEISHFGDAMEDLAAVCVRDMVTPFVDLPSLFAQYDSLTEWPLDLDRVRYHRVSKCVRSLMAIVSLAELGHRRGDRLTWQAYRALYVRGACQALAEAMGVDFAALRDSATAETAELEQLLGSAVATNETGLRQLDDAIREGALGCDDLDVLRFLSARAERQCVLMRRAMGEMADGRFSPIE